MKDRALVLSGGGQLGIAWELGILPGLQVGGVDARDADLVVGTSAGAYVGAQIAMGMTPDEIMAAFQASQGEPGTLPDRDFFLEKVLEGHRGDKPPQDVYAELGAYSVGHETFPEAFLLNMLGPQFNLSDGFNWTTKDFVCTAYDAADGTFQVWSRDSRVDLRSAVASSLVVPGVFPPVTINGRRYIDGALKSSSNAHLAAGYNRVLIVAMHGGAETSRLYQRVAERWAEQREMEVRALESSGARTFMVTPDDRSLEAFGPHLHDTRRAQAALQSGILQGMGVGQRVRAFWG